VRYLTGAEALEVSCFAGRVATERTEDSFAATLFLGRPGGGTILAAISASRGTRSRYGEIRLIGAEGQIAADHAHHRVALLQGNRVVRDEQVPDVPTVREALAAFEHMVRGGESAPITPLDGVRAVAIVDACYRSLRSGRREAVVQAQEN
jgi:predicted dehydrogenase